MPKEITIILPVRDVFALVCSGIKEPSKRKKFGSFGLCNKFKKQMEEQITSSEFRELKTEWSKLKSDLPAFTPKKIKSNTPTSVPKGPSLRIGTTRVWKPGDPL